MPQTDFDVIGFFFTKGSPAKPTEAVEPYMANLKVKFDPKTGSTQVDESDLVNLDELIQTYKDQCGMEAAQKLIKNGLATQEDFADDGKHSGAAPESLETSQQRANAALLAKGKADNIADALGVNASMNEDQLAAIIGKVISEKYPNIIKQEASKDGE